MIFNAFERMVAMRYLRARRQEGFISVIAGFSLLGIALGVATLIIVMAVMNGFRAELLGRVLGLNGHLNVYSSRGGPLPDFDILAGKLRNTPGVVNVTPTVEGQALVSVRGVASGAVIRGVRAEDFKVRPTLANNVIRGSVDEFGEDRVAIGVRMAQRLGLSVGDQITLIAPRATSPPSAPCRGCAAIPSAPSSMSACSNTTTASSSCRWRRRRPSSAPATP